MAKKIMAVAIAISIGLVFSAAPSSAAAKKSSTITILGPQTCCSSGPLIA